MENKSSKFSKLFGSGPLGLLISLLLLFAASWINKQIDLPPISENQSLLGAIFTLSIITTIALIIWSARSLRPADRGNKLCTSGPFKYVRHPLYAAYLSIFDFGLAIYLNSYTFILWAVLLHPLWHYLVKAEEGHMVEIFGDDYIEYQKTTGQFLPKLR
jgi:protein-S-isoprenylcysteine O-methyltransferase Ste14